MEESVAAIRADALHSVGEAERRIAEVSAARADANSDDEHDPEGATLAFERSQAEALRDAARRRVAEADAALARLDDGTYGFCTVCGERIAPARLAARPLTDRCIRHAGA